MENALDDTHEDWQQTNITAVDDCMIKNGKVITHCFGDDLELCKHS